MAAHGSDSASSKCTPVHVAGVEGGQGALGWHAIIWSLQHPCAQLLQQQARMVVAVFLPEDIVGQLANLDKPGFGPCMHKFALPSSEELLICLTANVPLRQNLT